MGNIITAYFRDVDMVDELVDIFDENNNPLGIQESKNKALAKGLWHRGAHIWIYNSSGEILMQLRAKEKILSPDKWDISAAGHTGAGEDVVSSALREVKEEIGLRLKEDDLDFWKVKKHKGSFGSFKNNVFYYIYFFKFDGDVGRLKLQKDEVQKVKFIPIKKLQEDLKLRPEKYVYEDHWDATIKEVQKRINSGGE